MIAKTPKSFSYCRRPRALVLLGAALAALAGCGERNIYVPPPPPKVTVSQPVRQQVTDYLEFTGNTQASNIVQLRARVEGYLEKVLFKDGDLVKKGQLLFLIQQNTYEAKLKQAEAGVLAQKARFDHAATEFARFSKLVQEKAASQTDLDRWRFEKDGSAASVLEAQAKRDLARLDLGYTKISAPFTGRIDRRLKDPGNLVGAGENTLLADINQINPIYAYFTINEPDLLRVIEESKKSPDTATQEKVPVYFGLANEEGYPHKGQLDFASIALSPQTGTLLLRGIFPNPEYKIMPGLFARVRTPVGEKRQAWTVPQVAVGYDQQGSYLLLVGPENTVERRSVKIGPLAGDRRVIEEGLTGQESVVVSGLLRAIPGRQVTPAKAEAPRPAPGGAKVSRNGKKKGKT